VCWLLSYHVIILFVRLKTYNLFALVCLQVQSVFDKLCDYLKEYDIMTGAHKEHSAIFTVYFGDTDFLWYAWLPEVCAIMLYSYNTCMYWHSAMHGITWTELFTHALITGVILSYIDIYRKWETTEMFQCGNMPKM